MKNPFAGTAPGGRHKMLHVFFFVVVLIRLIFPLSPADLYQLAKVLAVIVPPGLFFLASVKEARPAVLAFALGPALGVGLVIQGLLSFALTLTYAADWYPVCAALVAIASLAGVAHARRTAPSARETSSFGLIDLLLYAALFLGFGQFISTYGNLFDARVTAGLVTSPLIERHSIGIANFALNYSEYPFFTMFGWPYAPLEIPYRISHLPMPGFVVKAIAEWCGGDLLLALYFVQLFAFVALICCAGLICTRLFNRATAVVFSVFFSLHLMPIDRDYLLYLPSQICLLTASLFIIVAANQDASEHRFSKLAFLWLALTTTFLMLAHNQFLMVFLPALALYLVYVAKTRGMKITLQQYLALVPVWLLALFISLQQSKALYPSIYASLWDQRHAVIELGLIENIRYVYPSLCNDFKSFLKTITRYDLILATAGLWAVFRTLHSLPPARYGAALIFTISGIGVSLLFGNILDFEAGKSSILFLTFGLFFLTIFGATIPGSRPRLAKILCLALIAGFLLFPKHYRLAYSGSGSVPKEEYRTMRSIAVQLPEDARLLLSLDSFLNLYVGDNDEPEPEYFGRRSQRTCEMLTGRRCLYLNSDETRSDGTFKERLRQHVLTHRLTHLVTDDPGLLDGEIAPGITVRDKRQLRSDSDKTYYGAELQYETHFF